jgi:hypothetical protein
MGQTVRLRAAVLVGRVLNRSGVEDTVLKLGDELVGDGVLLGVSLLSGTRDDQVDLSGRGSDEISGLGALGLQVDVDTSGLLDVQGVQSAVGLEVDLLAVDDLNTRNNIVKENVGL